MDPHSLLHPSLLWFITGIALMFLELTVPGFILFFLGLGCWIAAGALLLWDLNATQQILVFLGATLASLLLLRRMLVHAFRGRVESRNGLDYEDFPRLARVKVVKSITPEENGRIEYRGSTWGAAAEESIGEGEIVELIDYADKSHLVFKVRKIQARS